jgi:hypothetical protein
MTSSRIQLPQDVPAYASTPEERSQPANPSSRGWLWFTLVLLLSALYMAHELNRGWIPSDDGVLAESAERVLHGALPHRDYHELFTGLLSYLNAAAFRALGTNFASMRYILFLFFLAWVPAFYYAASRFVSPPLAAVTTLLAVVWGLPNCATPMPSWYNLFFATFGLAALLRYIEVQSRRWLVVAGICGGTSFLFKMTGLYFVAGVLLFLAFREQMSRNTKPAHRTEILLYRVFLVLSVFSYEALLLALLRKQANVATYLYFWLPNLAIGAAIIWYEFYVDGNRNRRFSFLFRELVPFGAGVAFPIAAFLMPYFLTRSLSQFFTDLIIQPGQMILFGSVKPSVQWFIEGSVVNLLLIGVALLIRSRAAPKVWEEFVLGVPLALLIPSFLLLAHQSRGVYQMAWSMIWVLASFVVVLGVGLLVRWSVLNRLDSMQAQRLFITLSVTAACSLIQFPFTIAIYYCYIAPLVLLSATAVVSLMDHPPRLAVSGMMCFCFLYAVFEVTPGYVFRMGLEYAPDIQTVGFSLPRAGRILVSAATAREYEELDSLIRQHARGEYILAAPNCPQVYFLSGFRPPTHDFFGYSDDFGQRRTEGVLTSLRSHHINLVVLNHLNAMFVPPVPNDLHSALEMEFLSHAETENFEVRWRP